MAAEESEEEIRKMLSDGTRMTFITAGMGGGTGTGAAPVVARISKEMDILTVGIVTIPFQFEGRDKIIQALKGVENIAKNVDALLVINNERLKDIYSELKTSVPKAYAKADETLTVAAKSIAEIITLTGIQNLDFADVNTTMKNGGVALMSNGYGEGEDRLQKAIQDALNSPLLNNNDIFNAKRILFNIYFSEEAELGMDEMNDVHAFMARFRTRFRVKWGFGYDNSLGKKIKITILATGFGLENIPEIAEQRKIDSEEMAKLEEEREAERIRIEEMESNLLSKYGYDKLVNLRPKVEVVILSSDELDDDNLIAMLEDTPTYKRTAKEVAIARRRNMDDVVSKKVSFSGGQENNSAHNNNNNHSSSNNNNGRSGVISFR
jgi:cell division protein FtsZ